MLQSEGSKKYGLLEYAAKNCFFDFNLDLLHKIASHELSLDVDKEIQKSELILKLVCAVLRCSEDAGLDILEQNLVQVQCSHADLLSVAMQDDIVDDADRDKVDSYVKGVQNQEKEDEEIKETIRQHRRRSSGDQQKRKRKPVKLPGDKAWTADLVKLYLPPTGNVLRDEFNGRWRVWVGTTSVTGRRWSTSVSWGVSKSDGDCVTECLRAAWAHYLKTHPQDSCPIEDLLKPASPAAASSSSA